MQAKNKKIDLEEACKAVCPYCKMGMTLEKDTHIRLFGQLRKAGTATRYPCQAARLRELPTE